ncbi:hypothetical protein SDC9_95742 [bioreactor metagenome]|uniref:Uncharacterized protein n=1 Tax=bioreactor metagenome TaxID=1076179 RepID=A0A645AH88_9ZZZZ
MKKLYIIFCVGLSLYSYVCQQVNFEVFTHPYNLNEIPVYSKPDKFYSYLQSDTEAGWVVKIQEQRSDYFYVKLPADCDLSKKDIWVKSGDIGIVIQNSDSIKIPMYVSADTLSNSIAYVFTST